VRHPAGSGHLCPRTTCKARVWDNGDMTDCGAAIVGFGFCEAHLDVEKKTLRDRVAGLQRELEMTLGRLSFLEEPSTDLWDHLESDDTPLP